MIVNALGQSAVPRLALYSSQGRRREFRSLSNRLMLIGLALGASGVLVALVFGRQIITIVYGREYAQNFGLFMWLMTAAALGDRERAVALLREGFAEGRVYSVYTHTLTPRLWNYPPFQEFLRPKG